jgi:carbamoyl-phosphate synthase small subunit
MTGYQEICTDPSYRGQMVVLTYPLIGIYGVTEADAQSHRPWVEALVVRDYYEDFSNWRAEGSLHAYLQRAGVPAIWGVDTRALTRHLRDCGTMRGVLAHGEEAEAAALVQRAKGVTPLSEKDLVGEVTTKRLQTVRSSARTGRARAPRVVVIDCGAKAGIVQSLAVRGAEVVVVPATATASDVRALRPDGVVISNGPGDPASAGYVVETVRGLLRSRTPLLGICLGHQVLGIAVGGKTSRLKFGHHGGNHPVRDNVSGRVYVTSQNHEFQVEAASLPVDSGFYVSHVNLNDGSVEGLAHRSLPVFSVQYHPEASPGPHDTVFIFDRFLAACRKDS